MAQAAWRRTRYMPIRFTPSVISKGIGLAGPSRPIVRSADPKPAQMTQKRISPRAVDAEAHPPHPRDRPIDGSLDLVLVLHVCLEERQPGVLLRRLQVGDC